MSQSMLQGTTQQVAAGGERAAWDRSYAKRDNFLFHPHEDVIRFVARFIRKRVGLVDFRDVAPGASEGPILDLGCGIGRHVVFCHEMGLEAYGIDLSGEAIGVAVEWALRR